MGNARKTIVTTSVIVLACVLIVETVAALWAYMKGIEKGAVRSERHVYDPYRGHRLNPDYLRTNDTAGTRIHSPDGFREDKPVAKSKPDNTYRIFIMMGGSALYGIGSSPPYPSHSSLLNNETIDFYLEDLLNLELKGFGIGSRVEIVNAAVTGYHTFQHLIYTNETLYQYEPDLVVFLEGHNDYYRFQAGHNPWMDYPYSSVRLAESFNGRHLLFTMYAAVRPLSRFSYTMTMLEKGLQQLWQQYDGLPADASIGESFPRAAGFDSQYERVAHDSFLRAYTQIKILGDYYGFKLAFFLQPEIVFENLAVLSPQDVDIQHRTENLQNQVDSNAHPNHAPHPHACAATL